MDGNRRYPDEPQPSWYTGQSSTPSGNPYDSGVHDRPSGAFRIDGPPMEETRIPVRGPEYPAVRPPGATSLADAPSPGAYAPPPQQQMAPYKEATPVSRYQSRTNRMFRTRPPLSALAVLAVTGVLMIPAIMLLINATFGAGPMAAGAVVPAVLLALGLPLTGGGLYAVAGSAPANRHEWLRPPHVYLPIGLLVLLAAGLGAA
ncbi:hypothetical protein [Actinoplanes sp. NPDC049265]|uniref:hypothetical protein n=1 Tax=Actinoplanes sp. NPDC049265 TaxID=3363902 RepID=UPI003713C4AD